MKTFESLFAELSEKAAAKQAGSLTVDELGKGTHFIGKKIVEEAGDLPSAGHDDRPRHHTRRHLQESVSFWPCHRRRGLFGRENAENRRAQQGHAVRTCMEHAGRGRLSPEEQSASAGCGGSRQ